MPRHTQPGLVVVSLRCLGYMTVMAASSKASPISILRSINPRGMGITSPNEERMTVKVGCPLIISEALDSDTSDPTMALEHVRVVVCRCGYNNRHCRLCVEVRSISSVYSRPGIIGVGPCICGLAIDRSGISSLSSKLRRKGEARLDCLYPLTDGERAEPVRPISTPKAAAEADQTLTTPAAT